MRAIADDQIEPVEAVRAYHGDLQRLKIRPHRSLEEDLQPTATAQSYAGTAESSSRTATAPPKHQTPAAEPDFSQMTQAEKVQWNLEKWRRILD